MCSKFKRIRRSSCSVIGIILIFTFQAFPQVQVYFGNLHAHSNLSDGNQSITAREAFRIARVEGGLDFLCLSEHNHYLTEDEMHELIWAADQETTNNFVALFGQEYSTIRSGYNHTNILNYPIRIPQSLNGRYQTVFGNVLLQYTLDNTNEIVVAGFNHPSNITTDYGLEVDYNGDWTAFIAELDPFVQLIAVSNGPADANRKDFIPSNTEMYEHRNISKARWFDYLSHGMHLAPKIDHDSHSPTYGFRVAGRTAVWIDGNFNRRSLLEALANRHCYATEDLNLEIIPNINVQYLPGDIIEELSGTPLNIILNVSDSDEPNAQYTVDFYSGIPGDGQRATRVNELRQIRTGNGNVSVTINTEQGINAYYIIHVKQESTDPINGSTINDAWLAPIWIEDIVTDDVEEHSVQFASSRNSNLYHFINCRFVGQIAAHNLLYHDSPPTGKTLHQGCPQ